MTDDEFKGRVIAKLENLEVSLEKCQIHESARSEIIFSRLREHDTTIAGMQAIEALARCEGRKGGTKSGGFWGAIGGMIAGFFGGFFGGKV